MKTISFSLLLLLLPACGARKTLAERCAEAYPARVDTLEALRVTTDTLLIPATYVKYVDTTVCPPALAEPRVMMRTVTRRIPGRMIVHRDTVVERTVRYADAVLVGDLRRQIEDDRVRLARLKGSRSTLRWTSLSLALVVVSMLGAWLLRRLSVF